MEMAQYSWTEPFLLLQNTVQIGLHIRLDFQVLR